MEGVPLPYSGPESIPMPADEDGWIDCDDNESPVVIPGKCKWCQANSASPPPGFDSRLQHLSKIA